jgi:hypothetical protein
MLEPVHSEFQCQRKGVNGERHRKGWAKKTNLISHFFFFLFSRLAGWLGVECRIVELYYYQLLRPHCSLPMPLHASDSCSATHYCPIFMLSLKSSDQGLHNSDENGPRYPIMMRERGRGTVQGLGLGLGLQIFSRPLDDAVWRHMDSLTEVCGVCK